MSIGSAIGGAIGLGNALIGNSAEKKAARAAQKAADENNARQQMVYNNARNDLGGYLSTGQNALTGLNALAGGDYSGFQNSPDYQFALSQGLQGVDRSPHRSISPFWVSSRQQAAAWHSSRSGPPHPRTRGAIPA